MKNSFISLLRDKKTDMKTFRSTSDKITHLLAQKALECIKEKKKNIHTPLQKTSGSEVDQDVVLIPILRAGLAFLPIFLWYFDQAKVGFLGLKRSEETATPHEYHRNIPSIKSKDLVILLDPMIATGGTAKFAIQLLKDMGAKEQNLVFVSFISSAGGVKDLKKAFPRIKVISLVQDKKLNKEKYIIPGIGDFGDRYFG